jgi:hypothetical protein
MGELPLQNQPTKIINLKTTAKYTHNYLDTEKEYTYYYFENKLMNFHYYDFSKIHNINNYEEFKRIYDNIFRGDIFFDYMEDEDTFKPEMFDIYIELGIIHREDITYIKMYNFYKDQGGLKGYLQHFADANTLEKFQNYLFTITRDKQKNIIINQMAGLNNAYEFQDNIIIDKINNIYENHEYVYICFAPGNNHYIPEFFTEKIINKYKTAIIYISKLDIDLIWHPFWINVSDDKQHAVISKSIITSKFNDIDVKLTNKLDIYIFEYEIIRALDSFFLSSLNKVITKNTLFYYGFTSVGNTARENLQGYTILQNPYIKLYLPKDEQLFKNTKDFLQNGGISIKSKQRLSKRRKNRKSRRS